MCRGVCRWRSRARTSATDRGRRPRSTRTSRPTRSNAQLTRLERAQAIAAHESPRTTKLYDRTADEVTIEDIEKIGI